MRQTTNILAMVLFLAMGRGAAAADVIEKLNGQRFKGTVLGQTEKYVTIKINMGGGSVELKVPVAQIKAITVKGKRTVLNAGSKVAKPTRRKPVKRKPPKSAPVKKPGDTRTRAEVVALIEKAGATKPDWWAAVQLTYPKTLDLSWPKASGGWNTRKHIGHYNYSIIDENAGRWQQGTKFMHYVLKINEKDPVVQVKALARLGHCYHGLLQDWARAAYYWRKIDPGLIARTSAGHQPLSISLAHCYFRLGNKTMAVDMLKTFTVDYTRYGAGIKLWSDMGELDKALKLAEASRRYAGAYIAAGDACRKHGRYTQAITYYNKVLKLKANGKNVILKRNQSRAQIAINNIKLFETLDVKNVRAGTYTAKSLSYNGDLTLELTVAGNKITSVRVTNHKDKQYYTAMIDTPARIIKKQGVKGVDATTGATITSDAIISAAARALAQGVR